MQKYARIAIAFFGFISIFTLPPWIPFLCIILLALRYSAWEAIILGALVDLVWLPSGTSIHLLPLFTIGALIIVWGLEPIRARFLVSQ